MTNAKPNLTKTPVLYLRHRGGATHQYSGPRAKKLRDELLEGRGGPEVTTLVENGYEGFLGPDGQTWDFEALKPEHFN